MSAPNKPEYIWEISDIMDFIQQSESFLMTQINTDDGDEIAWRIAECINLIPAMNNALASAKWHTDTAYRAEWEHVQAIYTTDNPTPLYAASVLKDYIKSRTAEAQALLLRAEKLSSGVIHALDGLRSILSKLKEDRRASSYGQNL